MQELLYLFSHLFLQGRIFPNFIFRQFHNISSAQKMNFSIKDIFRKCDQIRRKLQIWSHLLKKSLMENFIFSAVISELGNTGKLEERWE